MRNWLTVQIALAMILCSFAWRQTAAEETATETVFSPPSADVVRTKIADWMKKQGHNDPAAQREVDKLWGDRNQRPSPPKMLQMVVTTFRALDADAKALIDACRFRDAPLMAPDAALLGEADRDPFFVHNLRLYFGRYLAQRRMYEEGLVVLSKVDPTQVVDPATCFFFKAVCEHHLLLKQQGLKTIEQLTERTEGVPARYLTVATLMRHDLEGLKDKSLDEISRKMLDVERRLELGRSGQKVQKVEEEIIAGLDEIIKKIEEQLGGGGGGGQGGNSNESGNNPADDSRVKGAKAPGHVDPKTFKKGGPWGELDDKKRERVRQLIGRDFPAHYRRAVEEYFRNAAKRTAPTSKN